MSSDSSPLSHGKDTSPSKLSVLQSKRVRYDLDDGVSFLNALPISDQYVTELSGRITSMQSHIKSLEERIAAHEQKEKRILETILDYRKEYPVENQESFVQMKDGTTIVDWGKSLVYQHARELSEEPCYGAERLMLFVQCLDRVAETLGHKPEHRTEDDCMRSFYVKKE